VQGWCKIIPAGIKGEFYNPPPETIRPIICPAINQCSSFVLKEYEFLLIWDVIADFHATDV
jgi:hypothetical protein